MSKAKDKDRNLLPDQRPITKIQAARLAAQTSVKADDLVGLTVAEISDKYRFVIDPKLLFFRKVCGRVVKKDPVTGELYPVPFATVHVEDTDCGLLGYFPSGWQWGWFYPFWCHREVIATAVTDECGNFCVYIPRWDIDWILRWRKARLCYPIIFERPTIRDILEELWPDPPVIRPPRPEPDPPPFRLRDTGMFLQRAADLVGQEAVTQLASLEMTAALGDDTTQQQMILDAPGFAQAIQPPLPQPIRKMCADGDMKVLSTHLNVEARHLRGFAADRFIGPFRRCMDVYIPEWKPILDVPDITFRVTQDVDSDGDEEVIYSENFFEVRWNADPIPDVTLEADPNAVAGITCDVPPVPCEDKPAILFAGLMPLVNPPSPADPYHDAVTGYGRRPNRPHASGSITPVVSDFPLDLATAPYTRVLQLYGCNEMDGGSFYRLRYQYNGGSVTSFTGHTWPLHRVVSGILQTHWPTPDANGWYPIIPASQGWHPNQLLLNWPTNQYPNGAYKVIMEIGNASKTVIDTSDPINFMIDNSKPMVQFMELRWRVIGGAWSAPLSLICPIVHRPKVGGNPANIEFQISYQVAATHLRSVSMSGGGCGGGTPTLASAVSTAQHWHTSPGNNSVTNTAVFALSGSALPGAYSFHIHAASRAFNPAGSDGGFAADWNYNPVYNHVKPFLPVAVVNV
ncbi:MAG: hypothetical protein GY796_11060 [Chloroflexi bacterium]|nr:hypothetical protein [Chloroflexota bacterium]